MDKSCPENMNYTEVCVELSRFNEDGDGDGFVVAFRKGCYWNNDPDSGNAVGVVVRFDDVGVRKGDFTEFPHEIEGCPSIISNYHSDEANIFVKKSGQAKFEIINDLGVLQGSGATNMNMKTKHGSSALSNGNTFFFSSRTAEDTCDDSCVLSEDGEVIIDDGSMDDLLDIGRFGATYADFDSENRLYIGYLMDYRMRYHVVDYSLKEKGSGNIEGICKNYFHNWETHRREEYYDVISFNDYVGFVYFCADITDRKRHDGDDGDDYYVEKHANKGVFIQKLKNNKPIGEAFKISGVHDKDIIHYDFEYESLISDERFIFYYHYNYPDKGVKADIYSMKEYTGITEALITTIYVTSSVIVATIIITIVAICIVLLCKRIKKRKKENEVIEVDNVKVSQEIKAENGPQQSVVDLKSDY